MDVKFLFDLCTYIRHLFSNQLKLFWMDISQGWLVSNHPNCKNATRIPWSVIRYWKTPANWNFCQQTCFHLLGCYFSFSMHKLTHVSLEWWKLLLDDVVVFWVLSFLRLGRIGPIIKRGWFSFENLQQEEGISSKIILVDELALTHNLIIINLITAFQHWCNHYLWLDLITKYYMMKPLSLAP